LVCRKASLLGSLGDRVVIPNSRQTVGSWITKFFSTLRLGGLVYVGGFASINVYPPKLNQ
jgi:hypothetical protein